MNKPTLDQIVALAGLAQSIRVVQNIAWKGETNETDFKAVLASVRVITSQSAVSIYGGSFELSTGLRILKQQLDVNSQQKDPEFINLAINLITLQKQVEANKSAMFMLIQGIEGLSINYLDGQIYKEEASFDSYVNECSTIYSNSISKMPNRIQVKGEPKFLEKAKNQRIVRAALLCAIRSVFLWRQSGGSRWHFLFKKKQVLEAVNQLINHPLKD